MGNSLINTAIGEHECDIRSLSKRKDFQFKRMAVAVPKCPTGRKPKNGIVAKVRFQTRETKFQRGWLRNGGAGDAL